MKAVKTIAALCFLTGIAIALVQPVLGAGDDAEPRVKQKVAEPADAAEPEPEGGETVDLAAPYPKRCLRDERAFTGLVAGRRGSNAEIGFPDRLPVARVEVAGDVEWSPSGRFLAERGGRVFDQSGNPQGALFFEPREWQWSPVADCALATTGRGWLTFSIADTPRKGIRLLNAPVSDFELSPNGRRLAAVVNRGGLWIADLRRGRIVQVTEGPASIAGWFSNRSVLYSKSKGEGKLRYASGRGKTRIVRGAQAGGTLVRCGGRTLLAGRTPGLAELTSSRGRIRHTVLTPGGRYSSGTCSPDGGFIAASTTRGGDKGPLVLLTADGEVTTELAPGRTANPQWTSEGLMYVSFGKGGDGRLWLIPPAAGLTPTAYRVGAPTQYDWHAR
ncbi:MAG: hypothetical protein M3134_12020 [Actinomycetota bacterium]|nr:hypothetical protein [Actinomycetota bacterium]